MKIESSDLSKIYICSVVRGELANNFTLVTHNIKEFSRVTGLLLEDWE